MELSLVRGIVPRTVFGLTAIAAIILVIGLALSKSNKRGRLHPLIVSLIAAVLAGAAGMLVAWLVSDVFMVFGVSLGWPVIFTIAGGIAGVGFVIAAAVTLRGVRRALAVVLVPLVLLSTALGVDSIYGEYQTIGTLVGYTPYASLGSIEVHKAAMSVSDWRSKAQKGSLPSMPSQGKVLTVDIPNAKSNFTARKAMIYLPPAALSDRPPALPVMELLAGQELSSGQLYERLNRRYTQQTSAAVVAEMVQREYINDARYAETRAHALLAAKKSRRAAAQNLRQKGLAAGEIQQALDAVYTPDVSGEDPELEAAAALVEGHYRKKLEAGRRDLVIAALQRRGFSYSVIKEAIRRVEEGE